MSQFLETPMTESPTYSFRNALIHCGSLSIYSLIQWKQTIKRKKRSTERERNSSILFPDAQLCIGLFLKLFLVFTSLGLFLTISLSPATLFFRGKKGGEGWRERGKRIPSRLHTQPGAQCGGQCPILKSWPESKSRVRCFTD